MNQTTKVGVIVAALVEEKGMTKYALAQKSGVSYRTVISVIDQTTNPRPVIVKRLADALGTSIEYLRTGKKVPMEGREECAAYPDRDDIRGPQTEGITVRAAIAAIARQLQVSEQLVQEKVAEILRDRKDKKEGGA